MRKVLIAQFGGTPSRTELCLLMECAAGIYQDVEFIIYPFDKDIESRTYTKSREYCEDYEKFAAVTARKRFANVSVKREDSLFKRLLEKAGIEKGNESILSMMMKEGITHPKEQDLIDLCYTRAEQKKELEGGYYGKANIGAVTSSLLVSEKIYDELQLVHDIQDQLNKGSETDVVIGCSSFGGTGASLGTNFGIYLADKYKEKRDKVRIHCINIQPYFSFPAPSKDDEWQIKYDEFYRKSAAVISAYANRKNFIKNASDKKETPYIFDSFYYLGQEVLDRTSDVNAAKDKQDNRLHMVDMLSSLAIGHILTGRKGTGPQLYGYLYSQDGTETISWEHMPETSVFKKKMVNFARFSAYMLQVIKPLLKLEEKKYRTEVLISKIYGKAGSGFFGEEANVIRDTDDKIRSALGDVIEFCKKYLSYWWEIEDTTRYGQAEKKAAAFFNQEELWRILNQEDSIEWGRSHLELDVLTKLEGGQNYKTGRTGLSVYDKLAKDRRLYHIGQKGIDGIDVARQLVECIYEACCVDEERVGGNTK